MTTNRAALVRQALWLEWLTAGWVLIEAAVALGVGIDAHSLTLIAFGADSVIELISACVLLWRLRIELRHGQEVSEEAETRAAKVGGVLLIALIVYVVASAISELWQGEGQEFSIPGLILAALAMPIMYGLAKAKYRIATALGSAALRTDAAESIACSYLSAVVVVGLLAQRLTGAWWVDSVSALALIPFLIREAREAWEGRDADP